MFDIHEKRDIELAASFSHSALDRYTSCSESYRLRYMTKDVPRPVAKTTEMLVGDVGHAVLEQYYRRSHG